MPGLVQYNTLMLSHVFHLGLLGFEILGLGFWISGAAWSGTDKFKFSDHKVGIGLNNARIYMVIFNICYQQARRESRHHH